MPRSLSAEVGGGLCREQINIANPGTYNLSNGVAFPTWAAGTGWTFTAANSEYLVSTIIPTDLTWSVIVRFVSTGGSVLFGCYNLAGDKRFFIIPVNGADASYNNGVELTVAAGATATGTIGFAGKTAYAQGLSADAIGAGGTVPTIGVYIGGLNNDGALSNPFDGTIQAFAIYNTTLSSAQMLALHVAMMGL